jgi:hypothetical protein
MKREQIIEILQKHKDKWIRWSGGYVSDENFDEVADAILALPLNVLSDEEVMKESLNGHIILSDPRWMSWFNDAEQDIFIQGAKWMRDEIIKRNQ